MYQERAGLLPNGNPFVPYNDDGEEEEEQQPNMQLDHMNLMNNSDGATNSAGGMMGSVVQTRTPGTGTAGMSGGDATAADEELKKKIALYYHQLVSLFTSFNSLDLVSRKSLPVVRPPPVKELHQAD